MKGIQHLLLSNLARAMTLKLCTKPLIEHYLYMWANLFAQSVVLNSQLPTERPVFAPYRFPESWPSCFFLLNPLTWRVLPILRHDLKVRWWCHRTSNCQIQSLNQFYDAYLYNADYTSCVQQSRISLHLSQDSTPWSSLSLSFPFSLPRWWAWWEHRLEISPSASSAPNS